MAAVEIGKESLAIHAGDRPPALLPLARVTLSPGGFNHSAWELSGDAWSVLIDDVQTQQRMLRHPPAGLAAQIAALAEHRRRDRCGTSFAWALFLLIPALLLALCWWQSERIVSALVDRIPVDAEAKLGELVFASTSRDLRFIRDGGAVLAVQTIGQRLTPGSVYQYRWHVIDNPAVNAFAVPGGIVVVHSGLLLAADSAEEVAGVLAHEVQHIEQRHSLKAMVHDLGLYALLHFALGDSGAGIVGKLATNLSALRFSREQEIDADLRGLQALRRAGIDAAGMKLFFRKLSAMEGKDIPLLSTHPASRERLEALDRATQQDGSAPAQRMDYDWHRIKAELAAARKPR